MHSLSANKDLLISAPSILVCRFAEEVSAPRSLPAKSINENLPWIRFKPGDLTMIWNTACDLDEFVFAEVCPDVLALFPC